MPWNRLRNSVPVLQPGLSGVDRTRSAMAAGTDFSRSDYCFSRGISCKYPGDPEVAVVRQHEDRSFMTIVHLLPETPCDPFKTLPVEMKHRSAEVFHRCETLLPHRMRDPHSTLAVLNTLSAPAILPVQSLR
jgi:hypothetical protein